MSEFSVLKLPKVAYPLSKIILTQKGYLSLHPLSCLIWLRNLLSANWLINKHFVVLVVLVRSESVSCFHS